MLLHPPLSCVLDEVAPQWHSCHTKGSTPIPTPALPAPVFMQSCKTAPGEKHPLLFAELVLRWVTASWCTVWLHECWSQQQGEGSAGQGRGAGGGWVGEWVTSSCSTTSLKWWWSWDTSPMRMSNSAAFCIFCACSKQQISDKKYKCEKSGYVAIIIDVKFSCGWLGFY